MIAAAQEVRLVGPEDVVKLVERAMKEYLAFINSSNRSEEFERRVTEQFGLVAYDLVKAMREDLATIQRLNSSPSS